MLALFGSLDALRAALDCSAGGAIDSWLSMGALISLEGLRAVQPERSQQFGFSNSCPLRRAQGVQSAKNQIVGFLKPRLRCTTLLTPSMGFAATRPAGAVQKRS